MTGASGFIGRALIERLTASGDRVVALTRGRAATLPAGIEIRTADLGDPSGIGPAVVQDVRRVFHCAGEIRDTARMRAVHVDGTARLIDAFARAGGPPPHWVQLSSVGAYGPPEHAGAPRVVTEQSPEHPAGEYEVTKTASDRLVRDAASAGAMTMSMLRPSAVIGRDMSNASLRGLIALVRRGWFVHIGAPGTIANYVHVDDVVDALVRCGSDPAARGRVFNLSSDCEWTALIDEIAAASGVRPPRLRVPLPVMTAIASVAELTGQRQLTRARVRALAGRTRYLPAAIESALGFRFTRPLPGSIRELVAP